MKAWRLLPIAVAASSMCIALAGCESGNISGLSFGGGGGYYFPGTPAFKFWGNIRIPGPLFSDRNALTVLFDLDDPARTNIWAGGTDRYDFDLFAEDASEHCDDVIVSIRSSDGLRSDVRLANPESIPCRVDERIHGPDFDFPMEQAPVAVQGQVSGSAGTSDKAGVLEFFAPEDTTAAMHWTFFLHNWTYEDEANFDYRSSVGVQPGDPIPEDFCQYLVRARTHDGRVTAILPLFEPTPDDCSGRLIAARITLPNN